MKTLICSAIFLFVISCGGDTQDPMAKFLSNTKKIKTQCPELEMPEFTQTDIENIRAHCSPDEIALINQQAECIIAAGTCNGQKLEACFVKENRISEKCKQAGPRAQRHDHDGHDHGHDHQPNTAPGARFKETPHEQKHEAHDEHDHPHDTAPSVNQDEQPAATTTPNTPFDESQQNTHSDNEDEDS